MDICHQPWHQISPSVFQRIESTCHYHSSADGAITHHLPSNCLKKYEESRRKNAQMSIPSWKCSTDDIIESLALFFFFRLSHANISEPSTLITRAMQFVSPSCAEHQDVCMYVSREWRVSMWVYLSNPIKNPLNVPPFLIYKDRQYGIVMSLSVHQKKTCSVAVEFCTTGCLTLMLISKDCSAVGLDRGKARGTVS